MFIQVIQGQVADVDGIREMLDRWSRELAPGSYGWLGTTAGVTEDGTLVAVARFESAESARRNSERPEQTQWWMETAKLFAGEVAFHDSDQVELYLGGGSDAAGFVQIIEGRIRDADRMRDLIRRSEDDLAEFRPDLIGGLAVLHDDGGYTETAYFTSEEAAREGESRQPPPRLREFFEEVVSLFEGEPVYRDLREPWLYSPAG